MIQDLIDKAKPGDTVVVPPGQYDVDSVNAPVTLRSGITLDLTGVTLKALPNGESNYRVVKIYGVNNVTIRNGSVIGERDAHFNQSGGWGHGIDIREGSTNIKVLGTRISRCFGDGLYISTASGVEIVDVVSDGNRRQGMSVIDVNVLRVSRSTFCNTGGAPPGDGIDLECDFHTQSIKNVLIERCRFFNNEGSCIGVNGHPGTYANIRIPPGNSFDMTSQPIWVAGGLHLGTSWWAFVLNRALGGLPQYRWWGYRTDWAV